MLQSKRHSSLGADGDHDGVRIPRVVVRVVNQQLLKARVVSAADLKGPDPMRTSPDDLIGFVYNRVLTAAL